MSANESKTPQPPFTMSKYATEADLLRDKCKWLETENAELREAIKRLRQELEDAAPDPAYAMSDCGYGCHIIGGPFIAENPACPIHGKNS